AIPATSSPRACSSPAKEDWTNHSQSSRTRPTALGASCRSNSLVVSFGVMNPRDLLKLALDQPAPLSLAPAPGAAAANVLHPAERLPRNYHAARLIRRDKPVAIKKSTSNSQLRPRSSQGQQRTT
ncbi:MAG: hypothetical protein ACK56I_30020, partial [bacterium]